MSITKKRSLLILGPVLFFLTILLLPGQIFTSFKAKVAVGTIVWVAFWWITNPVSPAVTAFLPIILNAFFQMVPMEGVLSKYFSETAVLLFGAGILSISWEVSGVDKRIASKTLSYVGTSFRTQIIFWLVLSALMSSVIPNSVVVAALSAIAFSMLKYIGEEDVENSLPASFVLMSIAWGAGIGGILTPLGGSMNLVIISYLEELTGREFLFIDWFLRYLPIFLLVLLVTSIYLYVYSPENKDGERTKEFFKNEYKNLPPMDKYEKISIFFFVLAAILSFLRPLYEDVLPGLKPAYIFLLAGILILLISKEDGQALLTWKSVEKNMIWNLIFIFAGGLALGELLSGTGAVSMIGDLLSHFGLQGGMLTVSIIIILTILMSDITSNTATAAIMIPIVISVIQGLNLDPIPYVHIATIGVNISFTLPTSVRAVPVGYGMKAKFMFKHGLRLTLILSPILIVAAYFLFL